MPCRVAHYTSIPIPQVYQTALLQQNRADLPSARFLGFQSDLRQDLIAPLLDTRFGAFMERAAYRGCLPMTV